MQIIVTFEGYPVEKTGKKVSKAAKQHAVFRLRRAAVIGVCYFKSLFSVVFLICTVCCVPFTEGLL